MGRPAALSDELESPPEGREGVHRSGIGILSGRMTVFFVLIVMAGLPLLFGLLVFQLLTSDRDRMQASWAAADRELRHRHELIDGLLDLVGDRGDEGRELCEGLARLRGQLAGSGSGEASLERAEIESELADWLARLLEHLGDGQQMESVRERIAELAQSEARVTEVLAVYNSHARDLNVRCESVPSNAVALLFGFRSVPFFEISNAKDSAGPPADGEPTD